MAENPAGTADGTTVGAETPRRRAFLFPRAARIASRRRFEELYASPSKRAGRYLVAFHAPSETSSHRLGVTAAKRTFRDAWQRNRAKRQLREAWRRHNHLLRAPDDPLLPPLHIAFLWLADEPVSSALVRRKMKSLLHRIREERN